MAKTIRQRELNLLLAMDRRRGVGSMSGGKTAAIIALAVVVLLLVAATVLYFLKITELSDRKDELTIYLNDPSTQSLYDESRTTEELARSANAMVDAIAGALDKIKTYPDLTGAGVEKLFSLAGDTIEMSGLVYDSESGILAFSAACDSVTRIPLFIAQLRISGIFTDVTYEGYSGDSVTIPGTPILNDDGSVTSNDTVKKQYTFSIRCLVNPQDFDGNTEASNEEAGDGNE